MDSIDRAILNGLRATLEAAAAASRGLPLKTAHWTAAGPAITLRGKVDSRAKNIFATERRKVSRFRQGIRRTNGDDGDLAS